MSREFKQSYSSFNRVILEEFMTKKELKELDKKYSKAKLKRMTRFYSRLNNKKYEKFNARRISNVIS